MFKLAAVVFVFLAPTVMGIILTAMLTIDRHTTNGMGIVWASVAGAVIAIPASALIARQLLALTRKN